MVVFLGVFSQAASRVFEALQFQCRQRGGKILSNHWRSFIASVVMRAMAKVNSPSRLALTIPPLFEYGQGGKYQKYPGINLRKFWGKYRCRYGIVIIVPHRLNDDDAPVSRGRPPPFAPSPLDSWQRTATKLATRGDDGLKQF